MLKMMMNIGWHIIVWLIGFYKKRKVIEMTEQDIFILGYEEGNKRNCGMQAILYEIISKVGEVKYHTMHGSAERRTKKEMQEDFDKIAILMDEIDKLLKNG